MASRSYQRIEHERRFLLIELPPALDPDGFHWVITDHYVQGQRLRLRAMAASIGGEEAFKLTQKFRPADSPGHQRFMTTFYLTASEYLHLRERLADAPPLVKHRYPYQDEMVAFSVDSFQGALAGLVLADLEIDDSARLAAQPIPIWAIAEVTDDPRYEGGELARRSVIPHRDGDRLR